MGHIKVKKRTQNEKAGLFLVKITYKVHLNFSYIRHTTNVTRYTRSFHGYTQHF